MERSTTLIYFFFFLTAAFTHLQLLYFTSGNPFEFSNVGFVFFNLGIGQYRPEQNYKYFAPFYVYINNATVSHSL